MFISEKKAIHWIPCNSSFHIVVTHLMTNMHTPPLGLVFYPAYGLSRIRPVAIKRFFIAVSGGWIRSPRHTTLVTPLVQTSACRRKSNSLVNVA